MKIIGQLGILAVGSCCQYAVISRWSDENEIKTRALFEKIENEYRAEMLIRSHKHRTEMYTVSQHIQMLENSIKDFGKGP
jgi:hypothetical protein